MIYRSGEGLTPHQVRAATFAPKRRGLDPEQVYAFLALVADELARLQGEVVTSRTEAERMREGCGSGRAAPWLQVR